MLVACDSLQDFIPVLTSTIASGFQASEPALAKTEKQKEVNVEEVYGVVKKEWSIEACCSILVRKAAEGRKGAMKRVSSFAAMATPGGGWSNIVPAISRNGSRNSLNSSRKNSFSMPLNDADTWKQPENPNPLPREPSLNKKASPHGDTPYLPVAAIAVSALSGAALAVLFMRLSARK